MLYHYIYMVPLGHLGPYLRVTSPHVEPKPVMADSQVVEEARGDIANDVIDAFVVQRLGEVDSNRGRPLLVLAVAELTEETAAEHPDVAAICKPVRTGLI